MIDEPSVSILLLVLQPILQNNYYRI